MATTTNFLQKSTNGTPVANLEDSQVEDDGSTVDIGAPAASPAQLNVMASIYAHSANTISPIIILTNQAVISALGHPQIMSTNFATRFGTLAFVARDNVQGGFSWNTGIGAGLSEKMVLTPEGNLGIGVTVPTKTLDLSGTFGVTGNATIPNILGNLAVSGTVTGTNCFATSDESLKKNVKPKPFDRQKVLQLAALVSTFTWKDSGEDDFGLIAQEVEEIYPELVHTNEEGIKSINYAKISLLVLQMVATLV